MARRSGPCSAVTEIHTANSNSPLRPEVFNHWSPRNATWIFCFCLCICCDILQEGGSQLVNLLQGEASSSCSYSTVSLLTNAIESSQCLMESSHQSLLSFAVIKTAAFKQLISGAEARCPFSQSPLRTSWGLLSAPCGPPTAATKACVGLTIVPAWASFNPARTT